jgi:ketosteroid isomerase-like protein
MSDTRSIVDLVRAVNDCWRNGWYEQLPQYFDPDVVLAIPGFAKQIVGRDALVASYQEFGEQAVIKEFEAELPTVHVRGDTAVSTAPFRIVYEKDGRKADESGTDVLVLNRCGKRWCIVWRTVVMSSLAVLAA